MLAAIGLFAGGCAERTQPSQAASQPSQAGRNTAGGDVASSKSAAPHAASTGAAAEKDVVAFAPGKVESSAEIEALLVPIREKNHLPALIGAIVDDEKLLEIGVVGDRKFDTGVKATVDDLWHLGSCTKAMTATLIARLVEEGRLKWTTTIGEVYPELREKMNPAWVDVPIEWLLQNRGGAPGDLNEDGLWGRLASAKGSPVDARLMLVEGVVTHAPAAPPGTKNIYSNAGFSIAGAMAERVTGKSWEQLIRSEIFVPLEMSTADFGAPGSAEAVDQPWAHTLKGKKTRAIAPGPRADNPPAISPAGRVHCSFVDWGRFVSAHLRGTRAARGLIDNAALARKATLPIAPAMFEKLHTSPPGQDYSMGWGETTRPWGGKVFTHSGSNTMWFCVTWVSPEKNFAVLVGTNIAGDGVDKAVDSAAWALIQHHLKQSAK